MKFLLHVSAFLLCLPLWAAQVAVTDLPGGDREVVGSVGMRGQAVRYSATGELVSWTDDDGNALLAAAGARWDGKLYALEVLDPAARGARLLPNEKATVEFRRVSDRETDVVVTAPGGAVLTVVVEPERLGLRVDGPGKAYLLRGRFPCRLAGARIVVGGESLFPSTGLGTVAGTPQLLTDAGRTRALALAPPSGKISWSATQTDGWALWHESLAWQTEVKPGETLWCSSVTRPIEEGPVKLGLFARHSFVPDGAPAVVATLGAGRLTVDTPTTLTLSRPLGEIVPDGQLVAALLPVTPDDPVEASEQGSWFARFDHYSLRMLPVTLAPTVGGWTLAPLATIPPGVYRLRLWVAPKGQALPEALGGPKGTLVPYFPGFSGRATQITQSLPQGDVLVTVGRPVAGTLTVTQPGRRASFWRGEPITLQVQARTGATTLPVRFTVTGLADRAVAAQQNLMLALMQGAGSCEVALDSRTLAPGEYRAEAAAKGVAMQSQAYTFTIAPPPATGMVNAVSPLASPHDLAAYARLGVNTWVDVMPSTAGYTPAWPGIPAQVRGLAAGPPAAGIYDHLTRDGWNLLQGVQSRQISFGLHHSVPETVDETLRKHLIYAQANRRFPAALGLIFDYDLCGVGTGYAYCQPYINYGKRKMALLTSRWEAVWADAKAKGATDADKPRVQALFNAGIIAEMYGRSAANLRDALPNARHSSAVTADHAGIGQGQYLPAIYKPLDFRYLETWNDQIYPNGAHDMQESFWTSLLRMEQPAWSPIWITAPTAPQPGTHFRRALETISRGANGTGYNAEGNAGLTGGWGCDPLRADSRTAQELLTGALATRYGTWLNQFVPDETVGLLYSVSQGGTNFGQNSPIFFAYYTLAQLNRPARLLTENEIAAGALVKIRALLVVQQTQKLPAATMQALAAFTAAGGKVICDKETKIDIPGAIRVAELTWPAGLWPNGGNKYHALLDGFVTRLEQPLMDALGGIGRQPLEPADRAALVMSKRTSGATLVFVTNNRQYPFAALFTDDQQKTGFYRDFTNRGGIYYKDVRVPCQVTLALREDLAAQPPVIYDVFAGKELKLTKTDGKLTVIVDLATLSGRVLLLTAKPLAPPALAVGARAASDPLATLVVKSAVPLPVRIRVGGQEIFRAATSQGSCDTVALGRAPGQVAVEVTELVTGRIQRASLPLAATAPAAIRPLPAVQVWDAARLRTILKSPGLAIYVDARQADMLPAVKTLAAKLGVEVIFNPAVLDYPTAWDSPEAEEKRKQEIRDAALLAARRPAEPNFQWTGALVPATVWTRPLLLFGHARNNRLIADLNSVTLLDRPALPELIGAGKAIVEPVAAPFWNDLHAAVVLCADEAGLQASFGTLADLAAGKAVAAFNSADDGGARAERRRVYGFEPPIYPAKLTPLTTTAVAGTAGLSPVIPVQGIALVDGGALVLLHSPGRNLVRLDARSHEMWRTVTGGFYQPEMLLANAAGECLVSDGIFTWLHDATGVVRWKMLGSPLRTPEADGSAWVRVGESLKLISAQGEIVQSVPCADLLATSPDLRMLLVRRKGGPGVEKSTSALVARSLAGGEERWTVANLHTAEVRYSGDGTVIACIEHEDMGGRDDLERDDASRLTALDAASGKVLLRAPLGFGLTNLRVSRDGTRLVATGQGYTDVLVVADVPAGRVRAFTLPERGCWAYEFAPDGRELWVASERLYRVNLETLTVTPSAAIRALTLAVSADGLLAGTADGRVVTVRGDAVGPATDLLAGLAVENMPAALAPLREAPLVDSPWLRPHEVDTTFSLVPDYPYPYAVRGDSIALRADAVFPVTVAVRILEAGRYRILLTVPLGKDQGDAIKPFRVSTDSNAAAQTVPYQGDKWQQVAELDLPAGTVLFSLAPVPPWQGGWKIDAPLRTMRVERR